MSEPSVTISRARDLNPRLENVVCEGDPELADGRIFYQAAHLPNVHTPRHGNEESS